MPARYFCICTDDDQLYVFDKNIYSSSAELGGFVLCADEALEEKQGKLTVNPTTEDTDPSLSALTIDGQKYKINGATLKKALTTDITVGHVAAGTTFAAGTELESILRRMLSTTVVLRGITITTQPTKLAYKVGETMNYSGMVVTGTYYNTETEETTTQTIATNKLTLNPVSGYKFVDSDIATSKYVQVQYGGFVQLFTISVAEPDYYDVYICGKNNLSSVEFGALSTVELLNPNYLEKHSNITVPVTYTKETSWSNPATYNIYYVMVRDGLDPIEGYLSSQGITTQFTKEDIHDQSTWNGVHSDIEINGQTYHIFGFRCGFNADDIMSITIGNWTPLYADVYVGAWNDISSANFGQLPDDSLFDNPIKIDAYYAITTPVTYTEYTSWSDPNTNNVYYVMVRDGYDPLEGYLNSQGFVTPFTREDIHDTAHSWRATHADVTRNGKVYHVFGFRCGFNADDIMSITIGDE